MKIFWSVLAAILVAAGLIGGVMKYQAAAVQAEKLRAAKVNHARFVAAETLRYIRAEEERIYNEPTAERVEAFTKVFRLSTNFLPDLPAAEREHFVGEMNGFWSLAIKSLAERPDLVSLMPKPLE